MLVTAVDYLGRLNDAKFVPVAIEDGTPLALLSCVPMAYWRFRLKHLAILTITILTFATIVGTTAAKASSPALAALLEQARAEQKANGLTVRPASETERALYIEIYKEFAKTTPRIPSSGFSIEAAVLLGSGVLVVDGVSTLSLYQLLENTSFETRAGATEAASLMFARGDKFSEALDLTMSMKSITDPGVKRFSTNLGRTIGEMIENDMTRKRGLIALGRVALHYNRAIGNPTYTQKHAVFQFLAGLASKTDLSRTGRPELQRIWALTPNLHEAIESPTVGGKVISLPARTCKGLFR